MRLVLPLFSNHIWNQTDKFYAEYQSKMKLPIYVYGMPVLRETAKDILPEQKEEIEALVKDMFETLTASNGIGLAAPQIGKAIRVVVIDLSVMADDFPEYKDFKHAYFNAHIVDYSEETESMEEGCLSLPGLSEKVVRPTSIRVQYLDEQFQPHDEWVDGFLARVMQHEFDHLDGHVFIDRISTFRRQMIKSKVAAFQKGKVRCSYKVKTLKKI